MMRPPGSNEPLPPATPARRLRFVALSCALVAGALLAAAPTVGAQAADPVREREAVDLAGRAKAAYKAGRHSDAARLFMEAYARVPEPTLVFNAARAYQEGGLLREARPLFQLYLTLTQAGDPSGAAGRSEAQQHLTSIDETLAAEADRDKAKPAPTPTTTPTPTPTTTPGPTAQPTPGPSVAQPLPDAAKQKPVHRPGLFKRLTSGGWTTRRIAGVSATATGGILFISGILVSAMAGSELEDADERASQGVTSQGGVTYYRGVTQTEMADAIDANDSSKVTGAVLATTGLVIGGVGLWLWLSDDGETSAMVAPTLSPQGGPMVWSLQGRF